MRMTTENILKIRDKIRKKKELPHVQKPVVVNGRKRRTLSADIEILNGMWDNVRVGNEPGSTFGCGGVYRLACYISAASKRGSRAKPATRKAQSACGLPGEGNRGRCLCIARKERIQMSEKEIELYGKQVDKATGELRTTGTSSHCFLNRSGRPISLKRSYPEIDTKFFEYTDI